MDDAKIIFGNNIKQARKNKGISQEQLADMASLHRTYVGSIERGERNVSLENIILLARALELEPYELLKGID